MYEVGTLIMAKIKLLAGSWVMKYHMVTVIYTIYDRQIAHPYYCSASLSFPSAFRCSCIGPPSTFNIYS